MPHCLVLNADSFIMDTPGFSSINLLDITLERLPTLFPEFSDYVELVNLILVIMSMNRFVVSRRLWQIIKFLKVAMMRTRIFEKIYKTKERGFKMIKIAPSMLSANFATLSEEIKIY